MRLIVSAIAVGLGSASLSGVPELPVDVSQAKPPGQSPLGSIQPPSELLAAQSGDSAPAKHASVPVHSVPSPELVFSDSPTDQDIIVSRCLETRLAPRDGLPVSGENLALSKALIKYRKNADNIDSLEEFLKEYPNTRWRASILLNIGLASRHQARWSKVIPAWQEAWKISKAETSDGMRYVADRTLGELATIYASLGHIEDLEVLIDEAKGRELRGLGEKLFIGAKQSLGVMKAYPGEGFRCGPLALAQIYRVEHPGAPLPRSIDDYKSTSIGTNLEQVSDWAKELKLDFQVAFRSKGADVLVPSVIHWKVGHFAALTAVSSDRYLSHDSTFGMNNVVSKEVLDSEASGYFLVPRGNLPGGWRSVPAKEASTIFGKGQASIPEPPPPQDIIPTVGGDSCGMTGMTTYSFEPTSVSLLLSDTPVGYAPPIGPDIRFKATYCSQEPSDQQLVSNLGEGWTSKWINYLYISDAEALGTILLYGPGGGELEFLGYNSATGAYVPQLLTHDILYQITPVKFVLHHQDGSLDNYDVSDGGSYIFRSSSIDRFGNAVHFGYDSQFRLVTVTDAIGQVTTITYGTDPYRITSVTDPFGRSATFGYNGSGQLTSITDILNITSSFTYTTVSKFGTVITGLTTPYGTTKFTYYGDNVGIRGLQAQDPLGGQERIEWDLAVDSTAIPDLVDPVVGSMLPSLVPTGLDNANLIYRNSFYWSKKAMTVAPGDYHKAFIYHWLHDISAGNIATGYVAENTKAPLENRVWYAYPGQPTNYLEGTSNQPSKVARILDDGTEQDSLSQYNSLGNVTQSTDPKGRIINYNYDPNNQIDLLNLTVQNGATQELNASFTYNSNHLPLTATDASGQTTTYTYNSFGQVLTVTDPKNETRTFAYNSNGYLQSITGALPGSTTTFTYDGFGRVQTVTDSEGYAVTMAYDAADRPLKTTYPDGTFSQIIYNHLDPEWSRDRLGRWTLSQYDALRHIVAVQDPLLRLTLFEHCTCGALIGITDPSGKRTSLIRDLQQRITQKSFADGTSINFAYENTTSRLKGVTDANGQTKSYSYNLDNSLRAVSYSNTIVPTGTVNYSYDPSYPRITSMTDGVGTTTYTFNPINASTSLGAGRLAAISGPLPNSTVSYTYDELGRVLSHSINGSANSNSVIYDALGRIASVSNPLGQFTYQYVDLTSRVRSLAYPNAQVTNFEYYPNAATDGSGDGNQRLQSIQNLNSNGTNLSAFVYQYDTAGEIVSWNKHWDGGPSLSSTFTYDAAKQLVAAIVPNPISQLPQAFFYSYDLSGNRTQEQIDSSINTSVFNSTNEYNGEIVGGSMTFEGTVSEPASVTVGGNAAKLDSSNNWLGSAAVMPGANIEPIVATDAHGYSISKSINVTVTGGPNRSLAYDANGNLTNNGAGQTYQWDAENRLVTITQSSGTTGFVYDGAGNRVQETLNGTVIKQWVWCASQPCEERDLNGNVTKRFYAQGEQIDGMPYYFTRDHLGSVREMTDGTGAIRARYDYDPYGRMTRVSGDLSSDFGFTGYYYHQATGINIARYRAYDPSLGRWLSRDPSGENSGLNLYGYARNNPISFIDRLGLCCEAERSAFDAAHLATEAAQDQATVSTNTYIIKVLDVAPAAVRYFKSIQPEKPILVKVANVLSNMPDNSPAEKGDDDSEVLGKALETANQYAEFLGEMNELSSKQSYDNAVTIAENAYQQMLADNSALADASAAEFDAFVALLECESNERIANQQ
jgi:RHS repeat-associated protein